MVLQLELTSTSQLVGGSRLEQIAGERVVRPMIALVAKLSAREGAGR